MNIVLVGQKFFAASVAAMIRERHKLVGISCPPGDCLADSAGGVAFIPAGELSPDRVPAGTDVIVNAHGHDFISSETRSMARFGGIGYHPSLLPLHRGRDAIRWSIHMRERVTGGTVYELSDRPDQGRILVQRHVFILPTDDARSLWRRSLLPLGITLLQEALDGLEAGTITPTEQDHSIATWEPSFPISARFARAARFSDRGF